VVLTSILALSLRIESFPVFARRNGGFDRFVVLEVAAELIQFRQPEVMN
jgi:hypothetical protein